MKNNAGFVKGSAITSLIFSAGIGIGLYFLKQYHTDKVDQARIEGIEDFISSGSAAKYANGEIPEGEFPLCEMSSKQDWEVIVRYHPDKKSAKPPMKSSQNASIRDLLKEDFDCLMERLADTSQDGETSAVPKENNTPKEDLSWGIWFLTAGKDLSSDFRKSKIQLTDS